MKRVFLPFLKVWCWVWRACLSALPSGSELVFCPCLSPAVVISTSVLRILFWCPTPCRLILVPETGYRRWSGELTVVTPFLSNDCSRVPSPHWSGWSSPCRFSLFSHRGHKSRKSSGHDYGFLPWPAPWESFLTDLPIFPVSFGGSPGGRTSRRLQIPYIWDTPTLDHVHWKMGFPWTYRVSATPVNKCLVLVFSANTCASLDFRLVVFPKTSVIWLVQGKSLIYGFPGFFLLWAWD